MAKVVRISKDLGNDTVTNIGIEGFSLQDCKAILNTDGEHYTDDEVLFLRDTLYKLAKINYAHFIELKQQQNTERTENKTEQTETKIIQLKTNTNDETQSHPLYKSEYRRTS